MTFSRRWREAGHLSEKVFADLQPRWKAAVAQASAPLEAAQKASIALRQAMIEEAGKLGEAASLRIDAVKALQQRWQQEAQNVPLDRKHEQKLWDAFRKPIDEAFQRKSQQREQVQAALSAHDQQVLDASRALEAANASGDAQAILQAVQALEDAKGSGLVDPSIRVTGGGNRRVHQHPVTAELHRNRSIAGCTNASINQHRHFALFDNQL